MATATPPTSELAGEVTALIEALEALRPLLEQERTALAEGDIAAIEACSGRKTAATAQVDAALAAAFQRVAALGGTADQAGLNRMLARAADADPHLRGLAHRLRESAQAIEGLNRGNGLLAFTGRREAEALLGILLHNDEARTADTYDASGRTARPSGSTGPGRTA